MFVFCSRRARLSAPPATDPLSTLCAGPRAGCADQGNRLHTRNHKSEAPLENATDNPLDNSSESSIGQVTTHYQRSAPALGLAFKATNNTFGVLLLHVPYITNMLLLVCIILSLLCLAVQRLHVPTVRSRSMHERPPSSRNRSLKAFEEHAQTAVSYHFATEQHV